MKKAYNSLALISFLLFVVVAAQAKPKKPASHAKGPAASGVPSIEEIMDQNAPTVEVTEDIYRGTVLGAEPKDYPSTIFGAEQKNYPGTVFGAEQKNYPSTSLGGNNKSASGDKKAVYSGTVFGAEQKSYPSTTLGQRETTAVKKLIHDTPLIRAIKLEDLDRVNFLLYTRIDVNEKNYAGLTPLTVACEKGNLSIIRTLVEKGEASPHVQSAYGITPLISAVSAGQGEVVTYLLNHGADAAQQDEFGKTALMYAAKVDDIKMLKTLLAVSKPSINTEDSTGNTALIYAAQRGLLKNVKLLVANGAQVNHKNSQTGLCALSAAAAEGNLSVVKYLLKTAKAEVNLPDASGRTPVFYAIEKNQPESLKTLLAAKANPNHSDQNGQTPLMLAAAKNHPNCISLLLRQKKLDLAASDLQGRNAAAYSAYASQSASADLLAQAGVKTDLPDNDGNTPLMHAIKAQNDLVALFFIRLGADTQHANNQQETPLSLAQKLLPKSATLRALEKQQEVTPES